MDDFDHPNVADVLIYLVDLYTILEDYGKARDVFETVVDDK